jgi:hypothetical protein
MTTVMMVAAFVAAAGNAGTLAAQDSKGPPPAPGQAAPSGPAPAAPAADAERAEPANTSEPLNTAEPTSAAELLAAFAKIEGFEARFVEVKHLALLAAPLSSRGRLYFLRPGYLTRQIEGPEPSTLTISPTELRMSGAEGDESIDLRQSDKVRIFVTSLLQVFAGNQAALEASYEVAFTPAVRDGRPAEDAAGSEEMGVGEAGWALTLTPRDKPLTSILRGLTLRGRGHEVKEIVVREPNGDRTITRLEETNTRRAFTDEEKASLFGIGRQ